MVWLWEATCGGFAGVGGRFLRGENECSAAG